jgi:hypothetical protein
VSPLREPQTAPQMVVQVLKDHGLATVIAIFLIYWLTNDVRADLKTIGLNLRDHMQETTYFARQICINTAKNADQTMACEVPIGRAHSPE